MIKILMYAIKNLGTGDIVTIEREQDAKTLTDVYPDERELQIVNREFPNDRFLVDFVAGRTRNRTGDEKLTG